MGRRDNFGGDERRAHQRVRATFPFTLSWGEDNAQSIKGLTNNISEGGVSLNVGEIDRALIDSIPDETLSLRLDLPQQELVLKCRVCRTESFVLSGSSLGIAFESFEEPEKAHDLLLKYISKKIR